MDWFDQFLLPSIIIIPLIGASFLLFIPNYEANLRKRVAVFVVSIIGLLHARSSFLFFKGHSISLDIGVLRPLAIEPDIVLRLDTISFIGFSFLLITVFLLLFCELSKIGKAEFKANSKMLFILALSSAGLFSSNFGLTLLIQYIVIQTLFFINLREGGSHRSSTTLSAAIFFTIIDLGAYFVWTWKTDFQLLLMEEHFRLLMLLPFATRLLVPFLAPWSRLFFHNSAAEVTSLYLCTSFIFGASGLARMPFENVYLFNFSMVSVIFGTILLFSDRTFMQFHVRLSSLAGALTLALFAGGKNQFSSTNAVFIFACSMALVSSFGLLIQQAIFDETTPHRRNSLLPLWLVGCALILIVLLLGVESTSWKIILCGFAFLSMSFQLRDTFTFKALPIHEKESPYPVSLIVNAWLCFALVFITIAGFQILLTQRAGFA